MEEDCLSNREALEDERIEEIEEIEETDADENDESDENGDGLGLSVAAPGLFEEERVSEDALYKKYDALIQQYSQAIGNVIRPLFEYLMDSEGDKTALTYACGIMAGGGLGSHMSNFGIGFGIDFFFRRDPTACHALVSVLLFCSAFFAPGDATYGNIGLYTIGICGNRFFKTHRMTLYLVYLSTLSFVSAMVNSIAVDLLIVVTLCKQIANPVLMPLSDQDEKSKTT